MFIYISIYLYIYGAMSISSRIEERYTWRRAASSICPSRSNLQIGSLPKFELEETDIPSFNHLDEIEIVVQ